MFRNTGHWLPVNESFIPLCLSPLTDTLWSWLSCTAYCLPADTHSLWKIEEIYAQRVLWERGAGDCQRNVSVIKKWWAWWSTDRNGWLIPLVIKDPWSFYVFLWAQWAVTATHMVLSCRSVLHPQLLRTQTCVPACVQIVRETLWGHWKKYLINTVRALRKLHHVGMNSDKAEISIWKTSERVTSRVM